ncbi:hypothetical protein T492DRAFT_918339, partial [Pavlovales sp. CCMP2436]
MSNEGCVQHRGVQSRAQDAGDPFRSFQVADDIEDADLHDEDIGQQKRPGQMQLPGPGLEVGTNGGFDGPGGERALLEQTVPERAEAALYAIVLDGEAHDRSGQPAELDLETVKEVYKATHTVHAALK